MPEDSYTHGHHRSVVDAHRTRSIANSAAYLEPHLVAGNSLLDIGCGPGSITAEFADRLGRDSNILGVDLSGDVVQNAASTYADSAAFFATMDLYALDCDADQYDIVHAHQVLQHLSDPVAALREMRRVVRPDGIVAVRDADYAAMHWAPESPALAKWLSTYRQVAHANDAEPDAGRYLASWARQAGFSDITPTVDTWLFASSDARMWWGSTWAERTTSSSLAEQAIRDKIATSAELEEIAAGWRKWVDDPDGWFVVVHTALICSG